MSVLAPVSAAADTWIEIKAPNVTVLANRSTREARRLAWQLELKVIDVALTLATDEQRARARHMQQAIEREKPRAQAA